MGLRQRLRLAYKLGRHVSGGAAVALRNLAGHRPTRLRLRDGTVLNGTADILQIVVEEIFFDGHYIRHGLRIPAEGIILDVGANVGVFSVYAAQRTRGRVFSFEPFPPNVELIQRNVRENSLTNVSVRQQALSNTREPVRLFLSGENGGHMLFDHNIAGKLEQSVEVPSGTLADFMAEQQLDRIDFLKLDCEGSEGAILGSLSPELLRSIGSLAMEYHDNVSSMSHQQILDLLRTNNFETWHDPIGSSQFGYIYARNRTQQPLR